MFGLETLTPEMIGVLSAAIAGLLAIVPALGMTDQRRAAVAVLTIVVAVLAQDEFVFSSLKELVQESLHAAVYALATYKMVLQPMVLPPVQKALVSAGFVAKYRG